MAIEWMNFFEVIGPAEPINNLYQTLQNNLEQDGAEHYFNVQKWGIDQAEIATEMLQPTIKLAQPLAAPQPLKNGKMYFALKFIGSNSLPRENFLMALSKKYQCLTLLSSYDWNNLETLITQLVDDDYYEYNFNDNFVAKDRELMEAKQEAAETSAAEFALWDEWSRTTIKTIEIELENDLNWLLEDYYENHSNPTIYPIAKDFVNNQVKER